MFDPASASALFSAAIADVSPVVETILTAVLAAWGGLLAIRFARRKIAGAVR